MIAYCGAGISATSDALALALLGRDDVAIYDGSLREWAADPDLPLETGLIARARGPVRLGTLAPARPHRLVA